jgi:hypothetical protein
MSLKKERKKSTLPFNPASLLPPAPAPHLQQTKILKQLPRTSKLHLFIILAVTPTLLPELLSSAPLVLLLTPCEARRRISPSSLKCCLPLGFHFLSAHLSAYFSTCLAASFPTLHVGRPPGCSPTASWLSLAIYFPKCLDSVPQL